ncbi:Cytochrome P450 [Mycena indigotica]|uniref:Cytochrome P450 n=1 Tax=Mycena indigotica TaxID=2126181 RepID=A0A8H6WCU0_9AGAR|nr:Cytochrome P450 [Mycena indigotica]KAF7310098.1 Cytochrome P450 [Mycena indigotica]
MQKSLTALVVAVPLVLWHLLKPNKSLPLPPGPPKRFLTGNLHQLPTVKQWLVYAEWSKQYGPIMTLQILNRVTILITSAKVALDLLDARASIYSSRPWTWMLHDLAGNGSSMFSLSSQDPRFPRYRKMLVAGMNKRAVGRYRPVLEAALKEFLRNIATRPDNYESVLTTYSGGVALKIAYGYDITEPVEDDFFVQLIEGGEGTVPSLVQPFFFVEAFPFLRFLPKWFPLATFHRIAAAKKKILDAMVYVPNEWAKKKLETNPSDSSFFSEHYFAKEDGGSLSKTEADDLMWTAGAIYTGGAHTTSSAIATFLLLISSHAQVQARAREEIDRVVGRGRLVNSDDRAAMPYLAAILKETLRWAPPVPQGLRHAVIQDDIYNGYLIPKGSAVIANIWAITHDAEMYPKPFEFDPSRFLGDTPQRDPAELFLLSQTFLLADIVVSFVFGFGRRVCPGATLAEESVFLAAANLLALFDIKKALDTAGREVDPMESLDWRTGLVTIPLNFKFRLVPRSADTLAAMIDG